jgi:hypothetical protein
VAASFALTALAVPAHAQMAFDMSRVTCADYTAMSPATSRSFSAWMSGWFNQRSGSTVVNLDGYRRNVANVQRWCRSNPRQPVMTGLSTAVSRARPGQPGPASIDVAQVSCGQLLSATPAMQDLVVPWMSGWFMSSKNLTNVEMNYVDRNSRVIRTFCQSNRNVSLMQAFEQNWR